jgi:hypothetical protein
LTLLFHGLLLHKCVSFKKASSRMRLALLARGGLCCGRIDCLCCSTGRPFRLLPFEPGNGWSGGVGGKFASRVMPNVGIPAAGRNRAKVIGLSNGPRGGAAGFAGRLAGC